VCLGATAARAVLGPQFKLAEQRGTWLALAGGRRALATWHPSAVLRQPPAEREAAFARLVEDLALLREATAAP